MDAGYDRCMKRPAVVRGRLHGRVIELDEPVGDVEEGEVEVQIRSVRSATPRQPDLLDVTASLPEGHRTKADIDRRGVAEDRSDWSARG